MALDLQTYKEKLESGGYTGFSGASRAIGKSNMSKKDKEAARKLAANYYADDGERIIEPPNGNGKPRFALMGKPEQIMEVFNLINQVKESPDKAAFTRLLRFFKTSKPEEIAAFLDQF